MRNDSSREREYAQYLDEIEVRKQRVAVARADLQELKSDLGRFETEYYARAGAILIELAQTELATEENERRIWWLRTHPNASAAEIDADIETTFETRRQQLRNDENTIRFHEQRFEENRKIPELDPEKREELRRRYCDLVMRFLPDLARTENEGAQRAATMQRADTAYYDHDLDTLRALEYEPAYTDPEFDARQIAEKVIWAVREMTRVFDLRMAIGRESTDLRLSDTFGAWNQSRSEEDSIGRLVQQIEQELVSARARLATSTETLHELVHGRAHE